MKRLLPSSGGIYLLPLLLILITVESYILDETLIEQELLTLVTEVFPISQELLINNFEKLLQVRGKVGSIATIGLLWSATAAFHTLIVNINRAFPDADPQQQKNQCRHFSEAHHIPVQFQVRTRCYQFLD